MEVRLEEEIPEVVAVGMERSGGLMGEGLGTQMLVVGVKKVVGVKMVKVRAEEEEGWTTQAVATNPAQVEGVKMVVGILQAVAEVYSQTGRKRHYSDQN